MSHLGGELSWCYSLSNICSNLLTSTGFDTASAIQSHHHHFMAWNSPQWVAFGFWWSSSTWSQKWTRNRLAWTRTLFMLIMIMQHDVESLWIRKERTTVLNNVRIQFICNAESLFLSILLSAALLAKKIQWIFKWLMWKILSVWTISLHFISFADALDRT